MGHVIEGSVVARVAIPALMDDTTFFMADGRAEETVATYVEWITGWLGEQRPQADRADRRDRAGAASRLADAGLTQYIRRARAAKGQHLRAEAATDYAASATISSVAVTVAGNAAPLTRRGAGPARRPRGSSPSRDPQRQGRIRVPHRAHHVARIATERDGGGRERAPQGVRRSPSGKASFSSSNAHTWIATASLKTSDGSIPSRSWPDSVTCARYRRACRSESPKRSAILGQLSPPSRAAAISRFRLRRLAAADPDAVMSAVNRAPRRETSDFPAILHRTRPSGAPPCGGHRPSPSHAMSARLPSTGPLFARHRRR